MYNMPCRECQKRKIGCHSKCKEYANAIAKVKATRENERSSKMAADFLIETYFKNKNFYLKRHKRY